MKTEPKVVGIVRIRYHDQARVDTIRNVYKWSYVEFAQDLEWGSNSTLGAFTLLTATGSEVTVVKARILRVTFTPTGTVPA